MGDTIIKSKWTNNETSLMTKNKMDRLREEGAPASPCRGNYTNYHK